MTIGIIAFSSCISKGHERHEWYVGKTLVSYDFENGYKLSFSFETDSTCLAYFGNDYYDNPEEDEMRQSEKEMVTYTIEERDDEFIILKINHWGELWAIASCNKDTIAKYGTTLGIAVFNWEDDTADIELYLDK